MRIHLIYLSCTKNKNNNNNLYGPIKLLSYWIASCPIIFSQPFSVFSFEMTITIMRSNRHWYVAKNETTDSKLKLYHRKSINEQNSNRIGFTFKPPHSSHWIWMTHYSRAFWMAGSSEPPESPSFDQWVAFQMFKLSNWTRFMQCSPVVHKKGAAVYLLLCITALALLA